MIGDQLGTTRDRSIWVCNQGTIGCSEAGVNHKCWTTEDAARILQANGYIRESDLWTHRLWAGLKRLVRALPAQFEIRWISLGEVRDRNARR